MVKVVSEVDKETIGQILYQKYIDSSTKFWVTFVKSD